MLEYRRNPSLFYRVIHRTQNLSKTSLILNHLMDEKNQLFYGYSSRPKKMAVKITSSFWSIGSADVWRMLICVGDIILYCWIQVEWKRMGSGWNTYTPPINQQIVASSSSSPLIIMHLISRNLTVQRNQTWELDNVIIFFFILCKCPLSFFCLTTDCLHKATDS